MKIKVVWASFRNKGMGSAGEGEAAEANSEARLTANPCTIADEDLW